MHNSVKNMCIPVQSCCGLQDLCKMYSALHLFTGFIFHKRGQVGMKIDITFLKGLKCDQFINLRMVCLISKKL